MHRPILSLVPVFHILCSATTAPLMLTKGPLCPFLSKEMTNRYLTLNRAGKIKFPVLPNTCWKGLFGIGCECDHVTVV